MQLEGVGTISVCCFLLQILGQIDDHNGIERTFLQACQSGSRLSKPVYQLMVLSLKPIQDSADNFARCQGTHLHTNTTAYT